MILLQRTHEEFRWHNVERVACAGVCGGPRMAGSRDPPRGRRWLVRLGKWPKVIGGVRSWRGIKFDEFSFEVKKCGDGTAAEELMREFLESDGLDQDFCQSAFDTVHLVV